MTQNSRSIAVKPDRGFGSYGFPESHAASFANLVYASAWMKCRYPDVFAAALLNSQPMGFYAPSQIVRDAQEHGVEVRPADVNCRIGIARWSHCHPRKSDRSRGNVRSGSLSHKGEGWGEGYGLRILNSEPPSPHLSPWGEREHTALRHGKRANHPGNSTPVTKA